MLNNVEGYRLRRSAGVKAAGGSANARAANPDQIDDTDTKILTVLAENARLSDTKDCDEEWRTE